MSSVVKLSVPPFAPASPTSLSALRRPLIDQEQTQCDAHCQPCEICEARQAEAIRQAQTLSQDTGLRLSQLVEDALATEISRIEAEQADLVRTVLNAVLPHMADTALRSEIAAEIEKASEARRGTRFVIAKHPDLDLGALGDNTRLSIETDATLSLHHVELRRDGGATHINPDPLIEACLARLNAATSRD